MAKQGNKGGNNNQPKAQQQKAEQKQQLTEEERKAQEEQLKREEQAALDKAKAESGQGGEGAGDDGNNEGDGGSEEGAGDASGGEGTGPEVAGNEGDSEGVVVDDQGDDTTVPAEGNNSDGVVEESVEEVVSDWLKTITAPRALEVLTYVNNMGHNVPVTDAGVVKHQAMLRNTLENILELDGQNFVDAMDQVILIIKNNAKTFEDRLIFRGLESMRGPKAMLSRFENTLVLLTTTALSPNREVALSTIDMTALLEPFKGQVQQRIRSYFQQQ